MNQEQIENLVSKKKFSHDCEEPEEVIETHISWIFTCNEFAYKVKKPVKLDFLDFSTLDKRKFYCEREIELNNRLSEGIYLEVVPVTLLSGEFTMDAEGRTKDYAVKMKRMDPSKRMDRLLSNEKIGSDELHALADRIATFHREAPVEHFAAQLELKKHFEDYVKIVNEIMGTVGERELKTVKNLCKKAHAYIDANTALFDKRDKEGFLRDCHGDFHTENIFLLDQPVIFDCIEFNESLRKIDLLSEVAFLCMDIEERGYDNYSHIFFDSYNLFFPVATNEEERKLFVFYKAYRASVRAKINAITVQQSDDEATKDNALEKTQQYNQMAEAYLSEIM